MRKKKIAEGPTTTHGVKPLVVPRVCPKGHRVGSKHNSKECSPVECAVGPLTKPEQKQANRIKQMMRDHAGLVVLAEQSKRDRKYEKLQSQGKSTKNLPEVTMAVPSMAEVTPIVEDLSRAAAQPLSLDPSPLPPTPLLLPIGSNLSAAEAAKTDEVEKLSALAGNHAARMAFVGGLPKRGATDKEIADWAERKKSELLPLAMTDVEIALKFGTNDERAQARKEVLQMNGFGARESNPAQNAAIVVNLNGVQLPFMPKRLTDAQVVNADLKEVKVNGDS